MVRIVYKKLFILILMSFVGFQFSNLVCLRSYAEQGYLDSLENYTDQRNLLIKQDEKFLFSSDIKLSPDEQKANQYFTKIRNELTLNYQQSGKCPLAIPFYNVKNDIESTKIFSILRKMPKGALLHIHTSATGKASWIVDQAAILPDCYVYWAPENKDFVKGQLAFYKKNNPPEGFIKIKEIESKVYDFKSELYKLITFGPEDEKVDDLWGEFEDIFQRTDLFLSYKPVFMSYYQHAFETIIQDNIQYVELRAGLGQVIDEQGKILAGEDVAKLYMKIRDTVKKKYPEFDLKIIVTGHRTETPEKIKTRLNRAIDLHKKYPDFVIGFDLIGEEDNTNQTVIYFDVLKENKDLPYYFHSGESNWQSDKNLFPSCKPHWWMDFENELLRFPKSKHDDQCDALSQALNYKSYSNSMPYIVTRNRWESYEMTKGYCGHVDWSKY